MHKRACTLPVLLLRKIMKREEQFFGFANRRYDSCVQHGDAGSQFFDKTGKINPTLHPLVMLKSLWPESSECGGQAMLLQLDSLEWHERSKTLQVTYFKQFTIVTCETVNRISAAKFAYLVRYLSIWHPSVDCRIISEGESLSISTRVQEFCNRHGICQHLESAVDSDCHHPLRFDINCNDSQFGKHILSKDRHRYETSDMTKLYEAVPVKEDGDSPSEERRFVQPASTSSCFPPEDGQRLRKECVSTSTIRVEPHLAQKKPSYDRMLDLGAGEEVDICRGSTTIVKMWKHRMDKDTERILALKRPVLDSAMNDKTTLFLLKSSQVAYDFYTPPWPLHPILAMRPEESLFISDWAPCGSLHDLLQSSSRKANYTVRHYLQITSQLTVALEYLRAISITEVGVHPRNVLVMEHDDEKMIVRLSDRGTGSMDETDKMRKWRDWRDKEFSISSEKKDIKDLLITLQLSTRYRPDYRPNDLVPSVPPSQKPDIPRLIWDSRRIFSTYSQLMLFARKFLKLRTPDWMKALEYSLLDKSVTEPQIPTIMKNDKNPSDLALLETGWVSWGEPRVQELGKGHFGEVYRVKLRNGKVVAIKKLKSGDDHRNPTYQARALEREVEILQLLRHENVIEFIDWDQDRLLIELSYADKGNLLAYVKKKCKLENNELRIQRLKFCFEICKGMGYLHSMDIIHRDLACRNILLHSENYTVKITDFGLSRLLTEDVYEMKGGGALPLFWFPPSDMKNPSKKVTSKLDVWSFGVCMWEIYTKGDNPAEYYNHSHTKLYQNIFDDELYLPNHKLDKSETICEDIYRIMRYHCWKKDAAERPAFTELEAIFKEKLSEENM